MITGGLQRAAPRAEHCRIIASVGGRNRTHISQDKTVSPSAPPPVLVPGLTGSCEAVVGSDDTCRSAGTGELDMLTTQRVLALVECAALDALGDRLGPGLATVGVRIELDHLLAVAVGERVHASASLISVRGRRLIFAVKLHDAQERAVSVGRLTRAVVDVATYGRHEA
jgi:predicted thioesterase